MVQPELPIQEVGNGGVAPVIILGVLSIRFPPPSQPASDDAYEDHDVH